MNSHTQSGIHLEYDTTTDTYQTFFDPADNISLSSLVVLATAEVIGADLQTVCQIPLAGFITSEALNALFATPPTDNDTAAHVTFQYLSCEVMIQGDGHIIITPPVKSN
ncbi:HalOD1 output domain-containing protein [Halegenticoccus soli]|uniref:HalOD1 output domain-containing protein n=1 Tax=Halegenticoccus soli TaxID=1985678 RepID=UPI00117B6556|nr:HalOD1 output domain-containing protein [Halegenticoccus soli]